MSTKITVPADVTANLHGHSGGLVRVTVTDSGTTREAVTVTARDATPKALAHPAASWLAGISPRTFTLRPGQTRAVQLTVQAPRGAMGAHYTNLIFSAAPTGAGTVRLAASVGGTLKISHVGSLAAERPPGLAVSPPRSPGGLGLWPVLVLAAVVLALGVLVTVALRRRRSA